ncbi:MAG: hypothetical protein GY754_34890 [bacterium]|nr:hypothetical protein [bacterium]
MTQTEAKNGITVELDEIQRESLEAILKEIILNLPQDTKSDEEVYRSDIQENRENLKLYLFGYEMRALRQLLGNVRL